jgi:CubicO group peptidase (beta-lactamase class C family)
MAAALGELRLQRSMIVALLAAGSLIAGNAAAQSCEAYYSFDGSLADQSGGGHDGTMIGAGGGAGKVSFDEGIDGQALHLDGSSAMRAFLDLNPDVCPQVTITGWVRIEAANNDRSTQYIFSTGSGSGPGLRSNGALTVLSGTGNGLTQQDAIRDGRAWFFFAGVWDYEANTYRYQFRDRTVEGELAESRRPPEDAFWVGAYNDRMDSVLKGAYVDELRVIGKALTPEEITRLRAGRPAAVVKLEGRADTGATADAGNTSVSGTGIPQAVPGISDRINTTTPDIDPDSLPDRPPDLLSGGLTTTESEIPLLETPEGLGAANDGTMDPNLTMPEDLPGQELQEDLDTIGLQIGSSEPLLEVPEELQDANAGRLDPNLTAPENDPASELQDTLQTIAENPPPPGPPNEAIVCDTPGTPILRATIAGNFPADFLNALTQARQCGDKVTVASLNGNDQWIVSTPDQIAWSDNVPSTLATKLEEFENIHGGLDAADIAEAGAWVIVSATEFAQEGLPANAINRLQVMSRNGTRAASFDFHPQDNSRWVMVDATGLITGDGLVPTLRDERPYFQVSKRVPHDVVYTPDGSWVMAGNDLWFSTNDVRRSIISDMSAIRRSGRRIDLVVFNDNQGNYMILSSGPEPARPSDPIYQLEQNMANSNIWARRFTHKLRGVSIAVVRNNSIEWARGYGVRNENEWESWVRPDTTFDAASLSKPLAAFGIMQLVDDGKIDLQKEGVLQDIETLISGINRPGYRDRVRPEVSNLVQVLQHCASICYEYTPTCADPGGSGGGAGQYDVDGNLPNVSQLIRGSGPAYKSHRLIRTGNPGIRSGYTSGNYMLVQALIEVHGGGFVSHMSKLLSDLGMINSTYKTPYPGRSSGKFARGHDDGGIKPMYAYPEMAAAGLVSTPSDYAKFVIAVNRDGAGLVSKANTDHYLGRKSTVRVFCDNPDSMALGIRHLSKDSAWRNKETFFHGGLHNGYRTRMVGLPGEKSGVVVFMTGELDDADSFFKEFRRAFISAYAL